MSVEVDGVNKSIKVDTISEVTSANGVAIDGLTIKDGNIVGDVALVGTTPTFTIGDGGAEDAAIIFDGNAQNFYIGLDDSADDLLIGLGSTVGTTPAIAIDENNLVTLPDGHMVINSTAAGDNLTLSSSNAGAEAGPQLVLHRDSSSPADNDVIGRIRFEGEDDGSNKTIYAQFTSQIIDAGDGSGGSEDSTFQLEVFNNGALRRIFDIGGGTSGQGEIVFNQPNQDMNFVIESSSLSNAFVVDAGTDGVGIGTSSPSPFRLLVDSNSSNNGIAKFNHSNATPEGIRVIFSAAAPDNTSATFLEMQDSSALRLQIQAQGNVQNHDNSYGQISDERIKQNITDANSQWNDIKALKVKNFERKDDVAEYGEGKSVQIGLIAQECEAVSPGLVDEQDPSAGDIKVASEFGELNEDGTIKSTTGEKVKAIKYSVLYMKAIKALQEAMAKIETLETKVKALEDA